VLPASLNDLAQQSKRNRKLGRHTGTQYDASSKTLQPGGISSPHACASSVAAIDPRFLATIDRELLSTLEGQVAETLTLFFALDPHADVPYHIPHEHLPWVALRPHEQLAEVPNLVLAVGDRHVFARPRYVDIESAPRLSRRCQRKHAIDGPPLRPIRRGRIAVVDRAMLVQIPHHALTITPAHQLE
jgi:hypothetical protein